MECRPSEHFALTSHESVVQLGELQMQHAMLRTSEDIISDILNWVYPGCGGRMGGRAREFKCQGECLRDWRGVWERRLAKPGKNTNLPQAPGKYTEYATTEAALELPV